MKKFLILAGIAIFLLFPACTIYFATCYTNWFLDAIWISYRPIILFLKPHVGGFAYATWLGSVIQGAALIGLAFGVYKVVIINSERGTATHILLARNKTR